MSKKRKTVLIVIIVSLVSLGSSLAVMLNSSANPKRIACELPPTAIKDKTWQEILTQKGAIDRFKILNTGSVKVPLSGMLNIEKMEENHQLDELLWVDVLVFLFHHAERGWFMIDTGLDSTFREDGNIKGFLAGNYIIESKQQHNQHIAAQLKQENKDIQGIFFTHLHGDHTAGLPELPRSIPKYVGKGDEYLDIPLVYHPNHLSSDDELIEIDWSEGVKKKPFNRVIDIFGDGSLLGIHTPGHSKGHLSYLLMTLNGPVLLTGDASHTRYGFTHRIEPGWVHDQAAAEKSLAQLVEFHMLFPVLEVIYGHQQ